MIKKTIKFTDYDGNERSDDYYFNFTKAEVVEMEASETGGIIQALRDMPTAEHIIKFADLKAVRYLGKDEKGICEYAIDADIIYSERNEE
jgi:hypothetical protein